MKLDIQVLRRIPLESMIVEVSGRDVRLKSEVRQTLDIQLVDDGEGTRVNIQATVTIEGVLATISKYLIEMQIKQVLNDFAENVVLELKKRTSSMYQQREYMPCRLISPAPCDPWKNAG
jgi:carbon monoxide dehydrogenase subunit G